MKELWNKIRRKLIKLRLQPIRVFCFHQVSETFDSNVYCKPDWIPLSFLRDYVQRLRFEGYEFISLLDAYQHIKNDMFRTHKYAVLTADDGLLSHVDLLPWLERQDIPLTMFINIKNMDGKTCGKPVMNYFRITTKEAEIQHASQLYCTKEQIFGLSSPILSIGMHGVTHDSVTGLSNEEFAKQLQICYKALNNHHAYIPFFAYPYGTHNRHTNEIVKRQGFVPVLADGEMNYNDSKVIHREILEYLYKCQNRQL